MSRTYRYLLGYLPEEEVVREFRGRSEPPFDSGATIRERVELSHQAVAAAPNPHLGGAVSDLAPQTLTHLDSVTRNPSFPEAIGSRDWEFKQVELDKLVCIQKQADWDYVTQLASGLTDHTEVGMANFSLTEPPAPHDFWMGADPASRAVIFSSATPDFRLVQQLVSDEPVTGRKMISFTIGWGVPFVTAVQMDARLYLRNGYHRACAARLAGQTHIPVLLIQGREFPDSGARGPQYFSEHLLRSQHPPTLADFFRNDVAIDVRLRSMTKVIRVGAEEFGVLAAAERTSNFQPAPTPPLPSGEPLNLDRHYLDFDAEVEDWGIYRLADGSELRLRQDVLAVRDIGEPGPGQHQISAEFGVLQMSVRSPPNLRGTPSVQQLSAEDLAGAIVARNLRFEVVRDMTSEYRIAGGGRVALHLTINSISRTDKFDSFGEPRYLVSSRSDLRVVPPRRARRARPSA